MTRSDHGSARGVRLTDERLEELSKEAERGYDPERLDRRRRGRPPIGSTAASIFQVRLEPELREALEARADVLETTPSDIARRALRAYLETDQR